MAQRCAARGLPAALCCCEAWRANTYGVLPMRSSWQGRVRPSTAGSTRRPTTAGGRRRPATAGAATRRAREQPTIERLAAKPQQSRTSRHSKAAVAADRAAESVQAADTVAIGGVVMARQEVEDLQQASGFTGKQLCRLMKIFKHWATGTLNLHGRPCHFTSRLTCSGVAKGTFPILRLQAGRSSQPLATTTSLA